MSVGGALRSAPSVASTAEAWAPGVAVVGAVDAWVGAGSAGDVVAEGLGGAAGGAVEVTGTVAAGVTAGGGLCGALGIALVASDWTDGGASAIEGSFRGEFGGESGLAGIAPFGDTVCAAKVWGVSRAWGPR
jgi:hypothetical protein